MTDRRAKRRPLSDWAGIPSVPFATPGEGATPRRRSACPLAVAGPLGVPSVPSSLRRGGAAPAVAGSGAIGVPGAVGGATSRGNAAPALAPSRYPLVDHPEVKAARHLSIVENRRRFAAARQRRARVLFTAASVLALCIAFGLVYLHVLSAQKQFEINSLSGQESTAQSSYEQLRIAVEADNSPARIMAAARRLGMQVPPSITFVPSVAGGTVTPTLPAPVANGSVAPGGVADWSNHKADLEGNQ